MIQFFHEGEEYTTRRRLQAKYQLPSTTIQYILENAKEVKRIQETNKHYFHKAQVEHLLDAHAAR
ncbi:hypothetical protein [Hymenobacter actinosclerus]|uniref:Uncharacterized protein n=1 Tax=Hymenobacter actinosclerus TaxID=82805 RepID=A0A1I0ISQ2_9BACT|nr:hypothetical protein [Hymenobacter actinosclerus]SET99555.1 hypothetical protein SAMN04487998_3455 [Hymenobacter actinosclerus]